MTIKDKDCPTSTHCKTIDVFASSGANLPALARDKPFRFGARRKSAEKRQPFVLPKT
jgi:hypothetical protein